MIHFDVVSSNIKSIAHHGTTLQVRFKNGGLYDYDGVSIEQFLELKNAESVGKHLNSMGIKAKKVNTEGEKK